MSNSKTLGIIFSNMHDESMGGMTVHRTTGSLPFGGRYRLIDFPLSDMLHAGIHDVGVITRRNYQSLIDHVGSGKDWDMSRKNGGLTLLPPFSRTGSGMYVGSLEAIHGVFGYISGFDAENVVVSDCDIVANLDLTAALAAHEEKGAGITLLYGRRELTPGEYKGVLLTVGEDGFLEDAVLNPNAMGPQNIYLHAYIINKNLLLQWVGDAVARGKYSFHKDILQPRVGDHVIYCHEFEGYFGSVDGIESYFRVNMELLDPQVRQELFTPARPVYTKVRDEPPAKHSPSARVKNSLVADGCAIHGTVENSILFRGVKICPGAVVKNAIIMQGTVVGDNAELDYVITDKEVVVRDGRRLAGYLTHPIFIPKGVHI